MSNNSQYQQSDTTHGRLSFWQSPLAIIIIAISTLIAILALANYKIANYEARLNNDETILLGLGVASSRTLRTLGQRNHVKLYYDIYQGITDAEWEKRKALNNGQPVPWHPLSDKEGMAIVSLDKYNVAHFDYSVPVDALERESLADNQRAIYYQIDEGDIKLLTRTFYFQEGHETDYEAAQYGLFHLNNEGKLLLADLVDEDFHIIDGME